MKRNVPLLMCFKLLEPDCIPKVHLASVISILACLVISVKCNKKISDVITRIVRRKQ